MNSIACPGRRAGGRCRRPLHCAHVRSSSRCVPALAALLLTVLLFSAAVALAGFDAFEVWGLIVLGGFGDAFAWQNTLQRAAPLILTGLAVALPAQAGRVIIGAEGALVLGGLAAAALGNVLALGAGRRLVVWPADGAGRRAGRRLCGSASSAALREKREVNETIASLLMTFIAIALFNQCVETVLRDPASLNKPSTKPLPDALACCRRCRGWTCTRACGVGIARRTGRLGRGASSRRWAWRCAWPAAIRAPHSAWACRWSG